MSKSFYVARDVRSVIRDVRLREVGVRADDSDRLGAYSQPRIGHAIGDRIASTNQHPMSTGHLVRKSIKYSPPGVFGRCRAENPGEKVSHLPRFLNNLGTSRHAFPYDF